MSIEEDLRSVPEETYGSNYREHILEMYKLYVEMADNISERRQTANSFFLTLHSAIVAFIGYGNLVQSSSPLIGIFSVPIALCGIMLCYLWYRLIRSYKDINSGKFKVVHEIERYLPLRLYDAEWTALARGEDAQVYLPFTHVEIIVPWVFAVLYLAVLVVSLVISFV
jgi:hypothetical protein